VLAVWATEHVLTDGSINQRCDRVVEVPVNQPLIVFVNRLPGLESFH
jgi:hypothetical protein